MATSINARIIDMQDKIGVIEEGKMADIIAVDGNPVEDIAALDEAKMVMKGGIFIKVEDIELVTKLNISLAANSEVYRCASKTS
jgi:hypothetical protein